MTKQTSIKLAKDFPFFAKHALRIRTKEGAIEPFVMNRAQQYIHQRLEEQLKRIGRVRALILKGRQQGCSTYVEGRFYHKTIQRRGLRTFILTHEQTATGNLFEMVSRYHEHCPVAPPTQRSNERALRFASLDSGYKVGTAGSKGVGRSDTIQLFHGSEVAFWPNAEEHAAGVLQAVPKEDDTEVILESTANGIGGYFHKQWVEAERGEGEFQTIFVPWYWQDEYRLSPPANFTMTDEERAYADAYDLDESQIYWRRIKTIELGDPVLFMQEYPATAAEAFQVTGMQSYIPAEIVLRARKNQDRRSFGAVVAAFDPKRDGDDSDAFIYRQGGNAWGLAYHDFKTFPEKVAFCASILRDTETYVEMLFIDHGGSGWEIAGMLREMGFGDRVCVVNFGASSTKPTAYANKRAEIWGELRAWLANEDEPVSIPDDDRLHGELVAPGYKYDSSSRIVLERKAEIKGRGLPSPDGADALAMTFARYIIREHVMAAAQKQEFKPFERRNRRTRQRR